MTLVHVRCSACGRLCFRYAVQYTCMRRERDQAWRLSCASGRDHVPITARELCDVSQRLIAWSYECMAGVRGVTPLARSIASRP